MYERALVYEMKQEAFNLLIRIFGNYHVDTYDKFSSTEFNAQSNVAALFRDLGSQHSTWPW